MTLRFGAATADHDRWLTERGITNSHPTAQRVLELCDLLSEQRGGRVVTINDLAQAIRMAEAEEARQKETTPAKRTFAFSTVSDLIKALSKMPADARVYLASDAEGNDWNPLDYIGTDEAGNGRMTVTLVPMHGGWQNYVPEEGGDA